MRLLITRRIANLHFKYIATTQKVAGSTRLAVLILRFSPICPPWSTNGLALTQRSPLARLSVPAAERPVCPLLEVKRTSRGHGPDVCFWHKADIHYSLNCCGSQFTSSVHDVKLVALGGLHISVVAEGRG